MSTPHVPSLEDVRENAAMFSLKDCAIAYLNGLALEIAAGVNHWPLADRIERRFKLSGYTSQRVDRWFEEQRRANEIFLGRFQTVENKWAVSH